MNDPLLKDIRRIRAQRSRDLARDLPRALAESRRRDFTFGRVVVDRSSGQPRLIFKMLRPAADAESDGCRDT